jgi:hypothetical protein
MIQTTIRWSRLLDREHSDRVDLLFDLFGLFWRIIASFQTRSDPISSHHGFVFGWTLFTDAAGKCLDIREFIQERYINGAFIIGAKEHGHGVPFDTRAIDGTVDSTLKDIVCPSSHTIGDVDYKSSLLLVLALTVELRE